VEEVALVHLAGDGMSETACIVMTTVSTRDQAKSIASTVIAERLAACAQTIAITSCYRWDGKIVDDEEQMILFKTMSDRYADLEKKIQELHPYDTPEIVRLPIEAGSSKYLAWIAQEVG
jgi:periplasmic divalent cation tolerance protein